MNPKIAIVCLSVGSIAMGLSGCATTGGTSIGSQISAQITPENIAKGTEAILAATGNRVLAKNPTYSGAVLALADSLAAVAASNASGVSSTDLAAILDKTGIDPSLQGEIVSDFNTAQGLFLTDFNIHFPSVKPTYALFITAVANGLYIAVGKPALPLPALPPAASAATPAAAPASAPVLTPTPSAMADPSPWRQAYVVTGYGPDGQRFVDEVPASVVGEDHDPGATPKLAVAFY